MYTGRFAPSPSGPLHMGSLIAALGSWLDARAAHGRWLVRIEDLDRPRCVPGADHAILRALARLGLDWDGDVLYQSERLHLYRAALEKLVPHTYWCGCTRREIADSSLGLAVDGAHIYPGTCRAGNPRSARAPRPRVPAHPLRLLARAQRDRAQVRARDIRHCALYRPHRLLPHPLAVVRGRRQQRVR